jgi:hydroxymethylpyrimidine/phosphomethylpyrimidine kinase
VKVALTIAGSDSGGGAGIQADLKTFEAHGVFGTSVLTAVTAQNTTGVSAIHNIPAEIVRAQLKAVFDDFKLGAIKTGMVSQPEIIEVIVQEVSDYLQKRTDVHLVVDPVMVATSGARLLVPEAVETLKNNLFPLATVLTPNTDEAELILDLAIKTNADAIAAVQKLYRFIKPGGLVLLKGGHRPYRLATGEMVVSDLLFDGKEIIEIQHPFITTQHTHGTGCTLSAAISANLAKKNTLLVGIKRAIAYLHRVIVKSVDLTVANGSYGPLRHKVSTRIKM